MPRSANLAKLVEGTIKAYADDPTLDEKSVERFLSCAPESFGDLAYCVEMSSYAYLSLRPEEDGRKAFCVELDGGYEIDDNLLKTDLEKGYITLREKKGKNGGSRNNSCKN